MCAAKVLVVEDDPDIAALIRLHLEGAHCEVSVATDGRQGLKAALSEPVDLVVLDLGLPELDGLELCRRLECKSPRPLILMLTARSTELDRVLGLEMGADDYLTKPLSVLELVARVEAIFRLREIVASPSSGGPVTIESKDLKIDIEKREVTVRNAPISLTAKEFQLLLH